MCFLKHQPVFIVYETIIFEWLRSFFYSRMNMYPWYRDSVGGQLGQFCGPMATTIKTENGYNDCMLALDYATQSKVSYFKFGKKTFNLLEKCLVHVSFRSSALNHLMFFILKIYSCSILKFFPNVLCGRKLQIWTVTKFYLNLYIVCQN